ncbi:NUDIX hydrolase [Cellulomonas hominis]|uniref:NUDIX domain-containing protein n=1 Tax=Cellulomonas hominis TaxID=156981 RepID=UPI001C126398|nr:NUDIX hydrolase [Cellulomonas hominis]MBU5424337.1 NUDIX hydrolase [Cellulomonas hominis]
MAAWQTHRSTTVYENPWIRVREDAVTRPDGGAGIYGVVEVRQPAVFVVPVTADDEVVLVELERYTVGRMSLEVPAGGSDGEDLLVAARRELREETGLESDDWQALGEVYSLNGVCRAPGRVFLARGARPVSAGEGQAEEGIVAVRRVPWPEVLDLVRTGAITDGESVAALMHAAIAVGRVR